MGFVAPSAATRFRFRSPGTKSRVVRKKRGWTACQVSFSPIAPGQTRRIRVSYRLPAGERDAAGRTRCRGSCANTWTSRIGTEPAGIALALGTVERADELAGLGVDDPMVTAVRLDLVRAGTLAELRAVRDDLNAIFVAS